MFIFSKNILNKLLFIFFVTKCVSGLLLYPKVRLWNPLGKYSNDERFQVYWNEPTEVCVNTSTGLIKPEQYGIQTNKNENFYGSKIVIFYEEKLGYYPKCLYKKTKEGKYIITKRINGGLPIIEMAASKRGLPKLTQDRHLAKAEQDIIKAIVDPDFDGLAVIDYEHWRPVFLHNWSARSVYKTEAIHYVQKMEPTLPYNKVVRLAEEIFNKDAKDFILETLRLGKKLRPNGKWGFYDFPLCEYKVNQYQNTSYSKRCSSQFHHYNDEMMWLFEESTALYLPIYFYSKPEDEVGFQIERNYVYAKLVETERILSIINRYVPVYLYSKNEYNEYAKNIKFYTKNSRCISIGIPAYYGVNLGEDEYSFKQNFSVQGVVIWTTSQNMKQRCGEINESMSGGLGKFLLEYFSRSKKCNEKLCNNHGRCVAKIKELSDNEIIDPYMCRHDQFMYNQFKCLCDAGFTGKNCDSLLQTRNSEEFLRLQSLENFNIIW